MNLERWVRVAIAMETYPAIQPSYAERLKALARECLREPASRLLDGEIYCAVHDISGLDILSDTDLFEARQNGHVLLFGLRGEEIGWIEVPPFTGVLKYAESLLPLEVTTICRDPRRVCATALNVRALANTLPLPFSNIF